MKKKYSRYNLSSFYVNLFLLIAAGLLIIALPASAQRKDIMSDVIDKYSRRVRQRDAVKDRENRNQAHADVSKQEQDDHSVVSGPGANFSGAARVDLSIVLALHPDMAFYSPVKGRFIRKFRLGENEDEALHNYKELQKRVFENEKIFKKDKIRLTKELKAIKNRYFSLRIEKNKKLNKLRTDLNRSLFETPKMDVAGVRTGSIAPTELTDKNRKKFEELFEAKANEVEAEFERESNAVSLKIKKSEEKLEELVEKIEEPLFLSRKESLEMLKKILAEINMIIKVCADNNGFSLVFNDSFSKYKYKRISLPNEVTGMNTSDPYYPEDDISAYLKALAKKAPSEDPLVKNVKGHQESLIFYIRDHLFSDTSVRQFYSQYYSRAFMFGKIEDLTNKTVELMLKKHQFSPKKIDLVLQALDKDR